MVIIVEDPKVGSVKERIVEKLDPIHIEWSQSQSIGDDKELLAFILETAEHSCILGAVLYTMHGSYEIERSVINYLVGVEYACLSDPKITIIDDRTFHYECQMKGSTYRCEFPLDI
ncbi:MAG: hypothetical protein Q8P11_01800 [bacterium]|nr:hypothetical protein [bacterium]